jgi:Zn-dependent peptidase ImmA (M78 family)
LAAPQRPEHLGQLGDKSWSAYVFDHCWRNIAKRSQGKHRPRAAGLRHRQEFGDSAVPEKQSRCNLGQPIIAVELIGQPACEAIVEIGDGCGSVQRNVIVRVRNEVGHSMRVSERSLTEPPGCRTANLGAETCYGRHRSKGCRCALRVDLAEDEHRLHAGVIKAIPVCGRHEQSADLILSSQPHDRSLGAPSSELTPGHLTRHDSPGRHTLNVGFAAMPKVRISALRFRSLLDNRRLTAAEVAGRVATAVRVADLAEADQDVEFEDLEALAKLFKRPWSYLLLDEAEQFPDAGDDNRTFANQRAALSPDLMAELEAADLMLDAAAELFPGNGYEVPSVPSTDLSAAELGQLIRSFLAVSTDEQLALKDDYAALRRWVSAVHVHGIYVSQRRLRDETIRAFSKVRGTQAIIVVDTADNAYARIFSVLHELCHVVLRTTGICDLSEDSAIERYCNAVAAEVLMPRVLLDQLIPAGVFAGSDQSADDALIHFSRTMHVSQAALLIRLRDYGRIDQGLYDGLEQRRAARRPIKGRGGSFYAPAINKVGRLYAHRVVDAVSEGEVDRQEAGVLLGIGEHLVDTFTNELLKGD